MSGRASRRLFFASMPPAAWRERMQAQVAAHGLDRRLRGAMFAPGNWHQSWSERVFDPTPAECDALLRIVTADLNSYWRFQADHLTRIPSVQSVKTDVPMETVKRSYAIPLS